MSFWKTLTTGVAAAAAYVGRGVIAARYNRGMQYATDEYIKFAGGAILTMVGAFLLNFLFVWRSYHGMQTILALVLFPVSLYYFFAPKLSAPLVALATANRAAAPGDQENVWLVRDGIADLAKVYGIGVFWILVYIVTTMVAPFDLYPAFFLFLNIFVVMMLVLLMTGKVEVSPTLYNKAFWVTLTLLLVGVLTVMVFREQLGPKWTELTAAKTSRVLADKTEQSIRNADSYTADWIEKNVFVNQKGEQLVIINGQAVPAEEAIAAAKARKDRIIRSATGKKEDGGVQSGKPSSGLKPFDANTWQAWFVKNIPFGAEIWNFIIVWHVYLIFGIFILSVLGLRKKKEAVTLSGNTKTIVVNSAPSKPWLAYILIAAGIGGAFYFYATQTSSGYAVTRNIVGSEDRVTQEDLRHPSTVKYVRARITNPDHPYVGKPLDVQVGAGFTQRFEMNRRVDPDDNSTIIVAPNKNFYVLRQTGMDKGANLVFGNWENTSSGVTGAYTIAPNPETGLLTATLAANGTKIQMEFKRFFQ